MKTCIRCDAILPLDQFYSDKSKKDGKTPYCKGCRREKSAEQYKKDPQKAINRAAARRDKDRLEYDLSRMGMTKSQYLDMLDAQGGRCAICREEETLVLASTGQARRLSVDHDHACCNLKRDICGKCNRGLLCNKCNSLLGMAQDDVNLLRKAVEYLERYSK